jgi:hypothetical protein
MSLPINMPRHLVDGIKAGKSAHFEGRVWTLADVGSPAELASSAVDLEMDLRRAKERIAELEAQVATASDVSLYEGFLPTSKSEINAQSLQNLKNLATIRGVKVDGDDKPAYLAALTSKED